MDASTQRVRVARAVIGGLGLGGLALVKLCSHADIAADVGRVAARSADEVAAVGAAAAHHGGAGVAHADEASGLVRAAEAGSAGPDVGLAVDVAEITADVVELAGGPSDDGVWFAEPRDLGALTRAIAALTPGETVGFVVREASPGWSVGGAPADEAALRAACGRAVCWVYTLPPSVPLAAAESAWQAADETPMPPMGGRVIVVGG